MIKMIKMVVRGAVKELSSTEAKTHFGALLDMAQREPVAIYKKGRRVAVMLSQQEYEQHEIMKLAMLQKAIDKGLASGISDRSFDEIIAQAEMESHQNNGQA